MSTLTALARVRAVDAGVAQPIATVRHLHLSERPLVFVPLTLAGEANAPLAALVGVEPDRPELLIVPRPRNRDDRFAFAAELARPVLSYIDSHRGAAEAVPADRGREVRYRYTDAPQVLVPNPGGIAFVRLFGRSTRFRGTDGAYPVHHTVPVLGRWLTFLADRAEHPGSAMLVALTTALAAHWATGQSAVEDAHLGALLGWIAPPDGVSGAEAAARAEDPRACPPAGPVTDPTFDAEVLAPALTAYHRAEHDAAASRRAHTRLAEVLRGQLEPTWDAVWRGVALLRDLPPGGHVDRRWADDRDEFTGYASYLDGGGAPQPRWDTAVGAAARLLKRERALATLATERAFDDPLVMADLRLTGEAFAGQVTLAKPDRIDDSGRRPVLRPRIMVVTADPVATPPGTRLCSPTRPGQRARVVSVAPGAAGTEVVLELSGGMGRSLTPPPGSVPEVGERVCYALADDAYAPPPALPSREETPWTHGGPPTAAPAGEPAEEWA